MMSERLYKKNLDLIGSFSPELARRIKQADTDGMVVMPSKSGPPTLTVLKEGRPIYLHSQYNPEREAARTVAAADADSPDIVVIGGFGLGYMSEAALARFPDAIIVVIEYQAAIMQCACRSRDLTPILASGRVDLVVSDRLDDIIPLLEGRATRQTSMLLHRPSADLFPDFYHNLRSILHSFLNSKEVNLATLARFEDLWTRNLLRNYAAFRRFPGVDQLYGSQAGIPAFIIGAGPSLSRNIHHLKTAARRGILIAVDTVYKVLLKHGIDPHFVVAVDPQLVNTQYFRGVKGSRSILITDGAVYPALLHNFPGRVHISAVPFPFAVWYQRLLGEKGALSSGGSVSTTAFDLATRLGCNPIALVGQDLAYSEERIHVRGASGEELWENNANRLTPITRNMRGFLKKNRTVRIPACQEGEQVWSDRKFLTFLWWFERRIARLEGVTVWNATEGGAAIKGAQPIPLATLLETLPERSIRIPEYTPPAPPDPRAVIDAAQKLLTYLRSTGTACETGVALLGRLLERGVSPDREQMAILDGIDSRIEGDPIHSALLSSTLQRVIHAVGEGISIEDGNEVVQKKDSTAILQQSSALYQAVSHACATLANYLEKYLLDRSHST